MVAATVAATDLWKATLLITNSNPTRFDQLKKDLHNRYTSGDENSYPTTFNDAHSHLNRYKTYGTTAVTPAAEGTVFTQKQKQSYEPDLDAPVANPPDGYEEFICPVCGDTGHPPYAKYCMAMRAIGANPSLRDKIKKETAKPKNKPSKKPASDSDSSHSSKEKSKSHKSKSHKSSKSSKKESSKTQAIAAFQAKQEEQFTQLLAYFSDCSTQSDESDGSDNGRLFTQVQHRPSKHRSAQKDRSARDRRSAQKHRSGRSPSRSTRSSSHSSRESHSTKESLHHASDTSDDDVSVNHHSLSSCSANEDLPTAYKPAQSWVEVVKRRHHGFKF